MLDLELKKDIKNYVCKFDGEESGGVLIEKHGCISFVPCANLSYNKENHYILSYLDYLKAEKHGKIIAMVHSQKNEGASILDNKSASDFNLYSIIYCWDSDKFFIINPELKSYLNQDFEMGKNDCFDLVRNYYKTELKIELGNYKRDDNWYINNPKIISDNFEREGFVTIEKKKKHDLLIFGKSKNELYHFGIYQENDLFLHHPRDSKSCIEDLSSHWRKRIMLIIRHKSLL